jgi:hypothetical protein
MSVNKNDRARLAKLAMAAWPQRITVVLRDGSRFTSDKPEEAQLFHFTPPGGEEIIFCVPRLVELHDQHPEHWELVEVPIDAEAATIIFNRSGLSVERLRDMSMERADQPGIGVFMEDGSFLVVDGNHRFFRRYTDGWNVMQFHVARPPHWHAALVDIEATRRNALADILAGSKQ